MKMKKRPVHFLTLTLLSITMMVASSCIKDASVAKRRGIVKDFSTSNPIDGCGEKFFIYESPWDSCTSDCSAASDVETKTYTLATLDELSEIKKTLSDIMSPTDEEAAILARVNASANVCIPKDVVEERPTNAIEIKTDFCSCIAGKSDIINNCDAFCASKTVTDQPILYVNTIIGSEIANHAKLGNLYKWCTVQLANDETTPQCFVEASDGSNTVSLPAVVTPGSNSFSVNILSLAKNRPWILNLVESKTGSNAKSKAFQINRKDQVVDSGDIGGALKITPISQYTCMTYGGAVDPVGNIIRTTYARIFFYYPANETPMPIAPAGGSNQSIIVCHDEQKNTGNDSALFDRLELIPGALSLWDKADTRFVAKAENAGKLTINKILETRLDTEFHQPGASLNLFRPLPYFSRPNSTATVLLGYMMVPFMDDTTKRTYCPTSVHFNGNQPLLNLLGEYMGDTEGIYFSEKEGETILDNGQYKTIYGTMLARQATLLRSGFYIQNGLKIKADASSMNSKTIHFYWPESTTADPLTQGGRKLFTVRTPDTLYGNIPNTTATYDPTTDKRIGCIPKTN